MSNTLLAFILGVVLAAAVTTALPPKNYDGFRLYEVTAHSQAQLRLLTKLVYSSEHDYDFFHQPQQVAQPGYVIVAPNATEKFQQILSITQIAFKLLPQSVTMILQKEVLEFQRQRLLKPYRSGRLSTDRYYTHDEIHAYIEDLAKRFPNRVFVKNVGRSYEGRTIKTLTVTNGDGRRNKNVNFMDGGFHAREWISPAAVLYIIEQLVENFEENAELLQDYDWVILPVVNPDGYEYTQLGPVERLWRKTRKPSNATCIGTDPNRNFDFHWNEEGASDDPCSNIYAGSKPFSEPEALIVADLIRTLSNRGVMYLTMHSQGKMILYPWGWTEELPETWPDLHDVAKAGSDAIFAYNGTVYTIGSSTNVLYIAAGAADDYAFNEGFPIAFTMELPKGGPNLHDPPPSLIDWYVKETWAGVRAMAKRCTEKYPLNWRG